MGAREVVYDPIALGAQCHRCPLNAMVPVPPQPAVGRLKLIIVGEAPGRLESNRGLPFVGPSGRMLDGCLDEAGFNRDDAHVTNAVICRYETDAELKAAIPCCAPRLATELAALPADIPILALGAPATRVLLGKAGVLKARGFVWHAPEIKTSQIKNAQRRVVKAQERSAAFKGKEQIAPHVLRLVGHTVGKREEGRYNTRRAAKKNLESAFDSLALIEARKTFAGRVVLPSVHPAFILHGADGWLPVLRGDIKRAVRWSQAPFPLEDEGPYRQTTSPEFAARLLRKMSKTVVVDIETDGADPMVAQMTCVGVCDVEDPTKIVILDPWKRSFVPVLRDALKNRTVITHNGPQFDELVLRHYGITYQKREDTLIAHHAFVSHLPKSLAHVGSVYTNSAPWKAKFKQGGEEKGIAGFGVKKEDLAAYNAADVRITALSWKRMQKDLAPERKVYELDMKMAALYHQMQLNGILVDQSRRKALSRKMKFRAAGLLGEMRALLGRRGFHPSRPNDIRHALFKQLKAPTYLAPSTPTGLPSTGAAVLEALKTGSNKAGKLADLIIRWRSANDVRAEYLENVFVGGDGRVHAGWGLGPVTGRPKCRAPNLLNTPRMAFCPGCGVMLIDGVRHKETCKPKRRKDPQPEDQIRDVYIAAPGHVLVYFDLSQCEMRFCANLSGDEAFIKACEGDVHAGNAMVIFAGIPGAVDALRTDPKGAGKKFRDVAKNCGFAITYLAEADKLFIHLLENGFDVSLETCQDIIDRIHGAYWRYYEYVEENVQLCRKQGFLRTPFLGRKRWLGFYPKPTDVANAPIQAGVADVMNERLLVIDGAKPRRVKQLTYAYDSATYEVPERDVETMKRLISNVWAEPVVISGTGRSFMQPVELKEGTRWSDFG
jgi:uracil-DNA glycosylase family 4